MVNFNGELQSTDNFYLGTNRAFLYADALFDTMRYSDNTLFFLEEHYFRLLATMRQLRLEIPTFFTQNYWQNEITKTLNANKSSNARVRTTIYREAKGLYLPQSHKISFLIQITPFTYQTKKKYSLGVFKDYFVNTGPLSNLKTTNRLENILASIYAEENNYDSSILLNQKKQIAETTHANLFILSGNTLKTPKLEEGCINGIIRNKVINIIKDYPEKIIKQTSLTVYDLLQADEVFITNSIIGIQPVTHFKRRSFSTDFSINLMADLQRIAQ